MLQVIPHLEHGMGTYFPKGGMIGIAQHLHAMAEAAGVRFKFKSRVESIEYESSEVIGLKVKYCREQFRCLPDLPALVAPTQGA
jgi:phytoene dehydrogenase-like protein